MPTRFYLKGHKHCHYIDRVWRFDIRNVQYMASKAESLRKQYHRSVYILVRCYNLPYELLRIYRGSPLKERIDSQLAHCAQSVRPCVVMLCAVACLAGRIYDKMCSLRKIAESR